MIIAVTSESSGSCRPPPFLRNPRRTGFASSTHSSTLSKESWKKQRLLWTFATEEDQDNENPNWILFLPMHNVYMRDYTSPVYKIALYMLQGNNRISMYICRILALFPWNLVVATGKYLRENHEFRVWGSRKLKFTHVPPDWTTWDKYMLNGIIKETF